MTLPTPEELPDSPAEDDDAYRTLARRPGFLIRRLHQIHVALFLEECAAFGVTPVQYSFLTALAQHPDADQASLGNLVGIDRTTTAEVLARLGARGLVERFPSPADRRMRLARLTPEGSKLLHDMDRAAQRAHDRTIAPLPKAERDRFLRDLMHLVDASNGYGRAPMRLP
jgi:DNA-binding MarR family transcriptional regulator